MTRVEKPCEHIVKVLKDATAAGVTFTPYGQFTEVSVECRTCDIYVYAHDNLTSERID